MVPTLRAARASGPPRGGWQTVRAVLAAALILLTVGGRAVSADTLDDQTRQIAKRLQCPVCEGVSVADSPSELAGQMRAVIRSKLEQGESEQQIVTYFVERYGDAVLVEPPRRGFGLAVWLGPVFVLLAGGAVLVMLLRTWLRPRWAPTDARNVAAASTNGRHPERDGETDLHGYAERARAELERLRREP
jgi:cytochrome c-type biogenesis protein CcmH